jgi:hypothetical protein
MKKGIESLKAAVMKDCAAGENCFSETGCSKERYKYVPQDNPVLLKYGKTKCMAATKCFHDFCGKYAWVIERAKLYADRTGYAMDEVLEIWEEDRSYWYMNYYQEGNQPSKMRGRMADHAIAELKDHIMKLNKNIEFYKGIEYDENAPASVLEDIKKRIEAMEKERNNDTAKLKMAELKGSFKNENVFSTK